MTITLKTSEKTKNMMIDFYNDLKREKTPQYAVFQAVDGSAATGHSVKVGTIKEIRKGGINYDDS